MFYLITKLKQHCSTLALGRVTDIVSLMVLQLIYVDQKIGVLFFTCSLHTNKVHLQNK